MATSFEQDDKSNDKQNDLNIFLFDNNSRFNEVNKKSHMKLKKKNAKKRSGVNRIFWNLL